MRPPDRLPTRLRTLANDLTRIADETSRHARLWSEHLGARASRSTPFTGQAVWARETPEERTREEAWRAETGLSAPQVAHTAAPTDFTAGVMARIAAQQAPRAVSPVIVTGGAVEPVRVLAGTVCISAMVALLSSCVLAILAPTQALAVLGWVLGAGLVLLLVVREILSLVISVLANSAVLISVCAFGTLAVFGLLRFTRGTHIVREA